MENNWFQFVRIWVYVMCQLMCSLSVHLHKCPCTCMLCLACPCYWINLRENNSWLSVAIIVIAKDSLGGDKVHFLKTYFCIYLSSAQVDFLKTYYFIYWSSDHIAEDNVPHGEDVREPEAKLREMSSESEGKKTDLLINEYQ